MIREECRKSAGSQWLANDLPISDRAIHEVAAFSCGHYAEGISRALLG